MKWYRWREFVVNAYTKSEARVKLLSLWNAITFQPLVHIPHGDMIEDVTHSHLFDPESQPIYLQRNL